MVVGERTEQGRKWGGRGRGGGRGRARSGGRGRGRGNGRGRGRGRGKGRGGGEGAEHTMMHLANQLVSLPLLGPMPIAHSL